MQQCWLVIFHSAVVFASGASWFVKDARPSVGFTVFFLWGSLWGMPLLFLVSGIGARYSLRTRSVGVFARERLSRLLVPFVVGLVFLVPPMFYLGQLGEPGFHESYWLFWLTFLNIPALARGLMLRGSWMSGGIEFDPAHLWFLYVLLTFSIALLPLFLYLRSTRGGRLIDRIAGFTESHGVIVLAAAAIPIALVEAAFAPDVNTGGWERLCYLFFLLYGYLIASDRQFETALRRWRRPALVCAIVATAALIGWAGLVSASGLDAMGGALPGWSALQGLAGWLWIASILGFAGSLLARRPNRSASSVGAFPPEVEPRWRRPARYANEAVLPFYVLHEPVIVAAAWVIVRWNAPIVGKYVALVPVSLGGTLALYEVLIRRFRLTRILFGMKPAPTPRPVGGPGASGPKERGRAAAVKGRTRAGNGAT
jgi:hypothetical protein